MKLMKLLIPLVLLCLTACATSQPPEQASEQSTGPTVYGQLSGSIDAVSSH